MAGLWTEKHAPASLEELAGQQKAVSELLAALKRWKPGHGLLIAGPAGCGKTALVSRAAAELKLQLFAVNASDERSARQLELLLPMSRTRPLFGRGRLILIDEVDGLSGSDRGGVAALEKLIAASLHPVVLIANDLWEPKLRPLRQSCSIIKLTRVPAPSIARRLREIAAAEGVAVPESMLTALARWSSGDLRAAITDLQLLVQGRTKLTEDDAAVLGSRERAKGALDTLPALFLSGSLAAGRRAIQEADADVDELLLWAATNLPLERDGAELADAYLLVAQADVFRGRVRKNQHWRFKAFAADLLAGLAAGGAVGGYVQYQRPERIALLGASRGQRAAAETAHRALGMRLHCSVHKVREQLPLLKLAGIDLTA